MLQKICGTIILLHTAYFLNACSTTLPHPKDQSVQDTIASYRAKARAITLNPDTSFAKRDRSQSVLDQLMFAEQTSDEQERRNYLEQAYEELRTMDN